MARGNHVDSVIVLKRFGLYIVTPVSPYQSFRNYKIIYLSKKHRVIGVWGGVDYSYKDYITVLPSKAVLIRRTNKYLFFRPNL